MGPPTEWSGTRASRLQRCPGPSDRVPGVARGRFNPSRGPAREASAVRDGVTTQAAASQSTSGRSWPVSMPRRKRKPTSRSAGHSMSSECSVVPLSSSSTRQSTTFVQKVAEWSPPAAWGRTNRSRGIGGTTEVASPPLRLDLQRLASDQPLQGRNLGLVFPKEVRPFDLLVELPRLDFATQSRIRSRETSWRFESRSRASPPRTSSATWRLNSMP